MRISYSFLATSALFALQAYTHGGQHGSHLAMDKAAEDVDHDTTTAIINSKIATSSIAGQGGSVVAASSKVSSAVVGSASAAVSPIKGVNGPVDSQNATFSKRENPKNFDLSCTGANLKSKFRTCNDKPLDGEWCQDHCECLWTGCISCPAMKGCTKDITQNSCKATMKDWKCQCLGMRGKDQGKIMQC